MANDKITIWGGQARFGRNPAEGEVLVGDASGGLVFNSNVPTIKPPLFFAYPSTEPQAILSEVRTKIVIDTAYFDPEGYFDTANSRYKPLVEGYYQFNATFDLSGTDLFGPFLMFYLNGSAYTEGGYIGAVVNEMECSANTIIYMNGTTDYVEVYARGVVTSGNVEIYSGSGNYGFFTGNLIRFGP